jgi:hypothetical protein
VLRAPKYLPGAIIQVPRRDADGNALGGVRVPDIVVPLGVHGAQNEPLTPICSLVGAYLPFAATKDATTGRQPSVRDRYKDQSDYVNRVSPRAKADGNALGGVRVPDIVVPLGVHGAQNEPLTPILSARKVSGDAECRAVNPRSPISSPTTILARCRVERTDRSQRHLMARIQSSGVMHCCCAC